MEVGCDNVNENELKFVLNTELNKLDNIYLQKELLSTIDIALFYNVINKYFKSVLNIEVLEIYDKATSTAEDVTKYLFLRLCENTLLLNFMNKHNLLEIIPNILFEMGNKKILTITDSIIENSNKVPSQMPIPNDENQIKRIFFALRKNYELYEALYRDKIWLINSEDNDGQIIGQARIKISPYMFFHLMGFDYKKIINPNKHSSEGLEFSRIFPDSQYAIKLLSDFGDKNVYKIMELLLESEQRFLTLAMDGLLSHTINIEKLEMKSFSFERMGVIQSASGMIFFDKQKAIDLGYGNSVQHINSDIILLNDFIRKYEIQKLFALDFVISPFDKIKNKQISDQQSIFLSRNGGGLNSGILDQQKVSISSSVIGYRENDFDYSITEIGKNGGTIVQPNTEPIEWKTFDDKDRKRVAQTIIESVPGLDLTDLKQVVNNNQKSK